MTGKQISYLMRVNNVTIRALARKMAITLKRVRHVRQHGLTSPHFIRDWTEAIIT